MAAPTREERALIRVRGAGSRKVPTVNFGFDFAFGNSEQARQQVPTPARSLRSNTKTPKSRRSTSRQLSKSPARRSREPSTARSIRQSSVQAGGAGNAQAVRTDAIPEETVRPAKRRRITPDVETPNASFSVEIPRSAPSIRAPLRRTASRGFSIAEDKDAAGTIQVVPSDEQPQRSPLFVPQDEQQKENETPKDLGPKPTAHETNLRTTKSGRILMSPLTFPEDVAEEISEVQEPENEKTLPSVLETPSIRVGDVLGSSKQNQRRRRNPLTPTGRRRHSSATAHSTLSSRETSVAVVPSQAASEESSSSSILPLADRISRYSKLARTKKTRPQAPTPEREDTPKEIEDDDDSYVEGSEPEPETPAVSKMASRHSRKRQSRSRSAETGESKKGKATFPILTHRLTQLSTLATIHEAEEDGSPFRDPYANPTERSQPNVVDILAQICRETITSMVERINEASKGTRKNTAKNKRAALEAFGKDLDDELFGMSEAVENRANLEVRVRRSKRENAGLQTEYLELRKEREQIALRCDAVRRQHWDCEEETRQKWTLSEAARRMEQEMERNEADDDEGLEFLLRNLTDTVSSASGHDGILDKVKAFNAQLQSMALLLEGRLL